VNPPRYFIPFSFIYDGVSLNGQVAEFRPVNNGQPCVLTPEHVPHIVDAIAKSLYDEGFGMVKVTLLGWTRYED
jgi:hypothetical protein